MFLPPAGDDRFEARSKGGKDATKGVETAAAATAAAAAAAAAAAEQSQQQQDRVKDSVTPLRTTAEVCQIRGEEGGAEEGEEEEEEGEEEEEEEEEEYLERLLDGPVGTLTEDHLRTRLRHDAAQVRFLVRRGRLHPSRTYLRIAADFDDLDRVIGRCMPSAHMSMSMSTGASTGGTGASAKPGNIGANFAAKMHRRRGERKRLLRTHITRRARRRLAGTVGKALYLPISPTGVAGAEEGMGGRSCLREFSQRDVRDGERDYYDLTHNNRNRNRNQTLLEEGVEADTDADAAVEAAVEAAVLELEARA